MEAGRTGEGIGVVLLEVEESHYCRFVQVLPTGQKCPKVEETEGRHREVEGAEGIAGRSYFRIGPAREKGKMRSGGSRRLSEVGRARQTISGLEFLLL
jgi:hypothetical protein